jgi:hypothetical protein
VGALALALAVDGVTGRRHRIAARLGAAYVSVIAVVGARAAMRRDSARVAPLVPVAIATMHFAYGWGFWRAVVGRLADAGRRGR